MCFLRRHDALAAVCAVLDQHGITHRVQQERKFLKVRFEVGGAEHSFSVPITPSDCRAPQNAVTKLRRHPALRHLRGEQAHHSNC